LSRFTSLLHEASPGRHFCQIHHSPESLDRAVFEYASQGLARGEGVALVIPPQRRAAVEAMLREAGLSLGESIARLQLHLLDADEMRTQCQRDGVPDWTLFNGALDGLVERFRAAGFRRFRLYGEISDGIWESDPERAIAFEELAARAAAERNIPVFCGYHIEALSAQTALQPIHELGRVHTDVLATEEDEALRIALDAASREMLGAPLSVMLSNAGGRREPGEHRLPLSRRIVLWLRRTMPDALSRVLRRAEHHFRGASSPETLRTS